ncbi:MAG: hypothetical protein WC755_09255 [Candidatus Woesearchaeota archaeon]|jgi:hypothetical protein
MNKNDKLDKFFVIDHNIEKGIPTIFAIIPKIVTSAWINQQKAFKIILQDNTELFVDSTSFFSDQGKAIEALKKKFEDFEKYIEKIEIFHNIEKNVLPE